MPATAIFLVVVIGILVAVVVYYLISVILVLRKIVDSLGKVTFGVRSIAYRTKPIDPAVKAMTADLIVVADALEGLVRKVSPSAQKEVSSDR